MPSPADESLYRATKDLRETYPGFKWVPPGNYHITELFLGEVDKREVTRVCGLLDSLPPLAKAQVDIAKVAQLPKKGSPKVIAAELGRGSQLCVRIHGLISALMPEYSDRRTYVPHITLARVRRDIRVEYLGMQLPDLDAGFIVSSVVLFESILRPQGPIYRQRHRVDLA